MPKFEVITQNNINYVKVDLGASYYLGAIDIMFFHDELKTDHIEIIKKSFLYFKKESTEQPAIISGLEFDESAVDNNFMIGFTVKCMYMNTQRIIKIPVKKYNKVLEDYVNEQSQRLDAIEKGECNNKIEQEINNLKQIVTNLEQRIINQETIFNNQIKNLLDEINILKSQKQQPNNTLTLQPPNTFNSTNNSTFTLQPPNNTNLPPNNITNTTIVPPNNTNLPPNNITNTTIVPPNSTFGSFNVQPPNTLKTVPTFGSFNVVKK